MNARAAALGVLCASFLLPGIGAATTATLEIDLPPGATITTSAGPLELWWKYDGVTSAGVGLRVRVRDERLNLVQEVRETVKPAERQKRLAVTPGRRGVFFVEGELVAAAGDALATGTTTVAVIPDNTRADFSPDSPYGMGCYFGMRFTADELRVAARLAALSGVAASREELRWEVCEPRRGVWAWDDFDRAVRACLEHRIEPLGLLDYWGAYHDEHSTVTEAAIGDFVQYARTVVKRYRPGGDLPRARGVPPGSGIRHWEIWNEPATFWFRTPAEFGRLTDAAVRAVRAVDPDARPFFANAGAAFDEKALGAMDGFPFGGVAQHFYIPPRSPAEGRLAGAMDEQTAFFRDRGFRGPLWITEVGWHCTDDPARQLAVAAYLVQTYVLGQAAGYERIFWYNFVADGHDKRAAEYGLLNRGDFTPKTAFGAFAGMVHLLEGKRCTGRLDLGHNVEAYRFADTAGGEVVVLWAASGEGHLAVDAAPASVELLDMFGNRLAGGATLGRIPLAATPHYLRGAGAADLARRGRLAGIPQTAVEVLATTGTLEPGSLVRVRVANHTTAPLSGRLALAGADVDFPDDTRVRVAPSSSEVVPVVVAGVRRRSDNRYPIDATLTPDDGTTLAVAAVLTEKVARRGTPRIDGDLDDWTAGAWLAFDSPAQAVGIAPWTDWNLSARYHLMWDDDHLYFAARVRDNVHVQPFPPGLMWEGDSWQLGFDVLAPRAVPPEPGDETGRRCIGMALGADGPMAASWVGDRVTSGIRLAVSRRDLPPGAGTPGTVELLYEAAIPAERLAPLEMGAGATFAFSALLNDNDGGGRAGWMESTPGIGTGFEPEQFDLFELR